VSRCEVCHVSRRFGVSAGCAIVLFVAVCLLASGAAGADLRQESPANESGTVSPEVVDADGTETVLVYFETTAVSADGASTTVDQLKNRADTAQEPLHQFAAAQSGVTVLNSFWLGNVAVVRIDHAQADVRDLATIDGVEHVGPNFEVTLDTGTAVGQSVSGPSQETVVSGHPDAGVSDLGGPTASMMSSHTTYGLDQIDAPEVWSEYGTKGGGASVAVLDTGVDPDHPDIDLSRWGDWDRYGNRQYTTPKDYAEHGTHVSGTVSGGDADGTYIGVAPNVELYHGAVLSSCDSNGCVGYDAQIIAGMQWAVENDADVISMSLGSEGYSEDYIDPIRDARSAGTLVVASIGNDGVGTSGSPGNVYDAISVGASDSNRNIAEFSSGEQIDTSSAWESSAPNDWPSQYTVPTVSAPGSQIKSSLPGGEYGYYQGTSMAAPHVSGAAALLQAATSADLSPSAIEAALVETATNPNGDQQDNRYGHGIINVHEAADQLLTEQFTVSIAGTNSPVTEGDPLSVDATIENVGGGGGTQTVTLDAGSLGQYSTTVTLSAGEQTTVDLVVPTSEGDAGTYTTLVSSEDDTVAATVTVEQDQSTELNLVDGEISDTQQQPISDASDTLLTITYVGGSGDRADDRVLVDSVPASDLNTGSDNPDIADSVGDGGFVDNGPGEIDRYFIELPNYGSGTQFQITAELAGYNAFDGVTSALDPGSGDTQNIRLEPITLSDYANEQGVVDTEGLRNAIDDWRANEIGTGLLRDVISAWRSGEPVT